jgi:hypothetical protein
MADLIQDSRYSKIKEMVDKSRDREREFCQTRSTFQIEKFIAGDEYTLASKYRHVSHNCYVNMKEAERAILQLEELRRKKVKLQKKIDNAVDVALVLDDCLDIELIRLDRSIEDSEIRVAGLLKEIDVMTQICDTLEKKNGGPITYSQFESEEPEYWRRRLASQMHQTLTGAQLGIGEGNYKAYLNALAEPETASINRIMPFNVGSANDIAVTALKNVEGVRQLFLQEKSNIQETAS